MQILQTSFHSPLGQQAAALRTEVFVIEQHVPPEIEIDHHDPTAIHFVALENNTVVGTLRIVTLPAPEGPAAKIGRVAVAQHLRNRGIGKQLMLAAIAWAREQNFSRCILGAQLPVIAFYEKLGFTAHGPIFDDAGIPHRHMTLELNRHV